MQKIYKAAIIGGGAAGLLCAVELAMGERSFLGKDVLLLEKNDRVGKKLIATGNGQGNLSNAYISSENYFGEKNFVNDFLNSCKNINLEEYFYNIGIPFVTDAEGRKYPVSKQASSVLDIIRLNLADKKVDIRTDTCVTKLTKQNDLFNIYTEKGVFFSETVVIAVGGKAAKQFGTDGTSYRLSSDFGHKITALIPSLVQLKTETQNIKALKGLKEYVALSAYDGKDFLKEVCGDLLFTEYGVSGNAVFKLSPYLVSAKNPWIKVEFLPEFTEKDIAKIICDRNKTGYFDIENSLTGLINKRIGYAILKYAPEKTVESIAKTVKNFKLKITGNTGFNNAQVTKGGVETTDVNSKTMESKLVKNLYHAGEVLNVDGECGGYNLTFAFITGIIAAKKIKGEL